MGRHKRKSAQKHSLCSVCCSPDQSSTSISRCSSCLVVHRRTVCASCLNRHIVTILSQDITNSVICPEQGCNAKLTHNTIKSVLLAFNHNVLWEEYLVKSNWSGTSEQWIKRFTARCPGCRVPIEKNGGCTQVVLRDKMNQFGGNPFGGGYPPQFPGSFPQQGFGQFGSGGGYFNSGAPFQGGNIFPGGSPYPLPSGFPSQPIGGQFGQGLGFPSGPGGFGYQQSPYGPPFYPGQQPPFDNPNYFGSGNYGKPRPRRSSRHRSHSRRRRTSSSSSSSDDEPYNRGSPYGGPGNPYANVQPFPNMPPVSPRGGSPVIPPRRPAW